MSARSFTLAAMAATAGLAACTQLAGGNTDPPPQAVVDAYEIAHGMAAECATTTPQDTQIQHELARLDAEAAEQIRAFVAGGRQKPAAEAIAALASYAEGQTTHSN